MKRKFNCFLHNIRKLWRNKMLRYKIRLVLFCLFLFALLSLGLFSLTRSYSFYESSANLSLDIKTAMFVVEPGTMKYNIDVDQIIPNENSYVYAFSISNFNETKRNDVDLEFNLYIQTTTNLPLTYRLYENEYTPDRADLLTKSELKQDDDGAWYNLFTDETKYLFGFNEEITNMYYLVIDFPPSYKNVLEYSDALENIYIIIDARQVI